MNLLPIKDNQSIMATENSLGLQDIYFKQNVLQRAVIVANFPTDVSRETLEDFLEVIVDNELDVIYPKQKSTTLLAVFKDNILKSDHPKILTKTASKKLKNKTVTISFMEPAGGFVIYCSPSLPTEDYLQLYLERPQYMGRECSDITIHEKAGIAVMEYENLTEQDISKILKLPHKSMSGFQRIEPYIPKFHDLYINSLMLNSDLSAMNSDIAASISPFQANHTPTAAGTTSSPAVHCLRTQIPESAVVIEKFQENSTLDIERKAEVEGYGDIDNFSTDLLDNEMKLLQPILSQSETTLLKTAEGNRSKNHDYIKSDSDENLSTVSLTSHGNENKFRHKCGRHIAKSSGFTEAFDLSKGKIVMLHIGCISKKYPALHWNLDTRNERVSIQGESDKSVQDAKLAVYEMVNTVKEHRKKIDSTFIKIFSGSKGLVFITSTLKTQKIRAFVGFDSLSNTMYSYAFSIGHAKNAISVIESKFAQQECFYNDSHIPYINSVEWHCLVEEKQNKNLILIQVESNQRKIVISGLGTVVENLQSEVSNLLQQHGLQSSQDPAASCKMRNAEMRSEDQYKEQQVSLPRNKTRVIMVAEGYARFLEKNSNCLKGEWSRVVTMKTDARHGKITLEGHVEHLDEAEKDINDYWSGAIDLRRISNQDLDIAIMSASLMSPDGLKYLREFEHQNACGVHCFKKEKKVMLPSSHDLPDLSKLTTEESRGHIRSRTSQSWDLPPPQSHEQIKSTELQEPSNIHRSHCSPVLPSLRTSSSREYHSHFGFGNEVWQQRADSKSDPKLASDPLNQHAFQEEQSEIKTFKTINNVQIIVKQSSIVKQKADCLVNFIGFNNGPVLHGRICSLFLQKGGEEFRNNLNGIKSVGFYPFSPVGELKHTFNLVLEKYKDQHNVTKLRDLLKECFSWCDIMQFSSIAFPAVGVGQLLQYQAKHVAEIMIDEAQKAASTIKSLKNLALTALVKEPEPQMDLVGMKIEMEESCGGLEREQMMDYTSQIQQQILAEHPQETQRMRHYISKTPVGMLQPIVCPYGVSQQTLQSPLGLQQPQKSNIYRYKERRQSRGVVDSSGYRSEGGTPRVHHGKSRGRQGNNDDFKKGKDQHEQKRYSVRPEQGKTIQYGSRKIPEACIYVYCKHKEEGETVRSKLSKEIKCRFLNVEKRDIKIIKEDTKKIESICKNLNVFVTLEYDKQKQSCQIELKGSKEGTNNALLEIYQYVNSRDGKRSTNTHRKGTREYWKHLESDLPTPTYWRHFKDGLSFMDNIRLLVGNNRCERYDVDPKTFRCIKQLVERTWKAEVVGQGKDARNLSHSRISVQKVERIENYVLFEKYALERSKLFRRLYQSSKPKIPELESIRVEGHRGTIGPILTTKNTDQRLLTDIYCDINEHYLFHGAPRDVVENIIKKGADNRYCSDKGMFGPGIYAAESSTKADQYADSENRRHQKNLQMFLMRVLLGNMFVTCKDHKYKLPPCSNCQQEQCSNPSHEPFDSVVGDGRWLFREFVVYSREQCYPEYIITYDRL